MTPAETRRRWKGLTVLGFGVALVVVDITIINVAMPTMIANLRLDFSDAEWVNAAYAVVFATFLITLGRIGDLWGRRRLFLTGLTVFLAGSLVAGRADALGELVGARALQGLGAAMILPATLAIVNATFRGRDRAIAFGIWGSVIGGMAAVGPVLGGWLTTSFTWRWVFYINVPIAVAVLVAAVMFVDDSKGERAGGRFDAPGFLTASLGFFALVIGLIEGPRYGWLSATRQLEIRDWSWPWTGISIAPLALLIGVLALFAFVTVELHRLRAGHAVLFDLRLFRLRSFLHGNLLATLVGLGEFGLVFVVPLYLQTVVQLSALRTGALLLAMAAGGFLGGPFAAVLAHRIGPRQVVTAGMSLEAVGAFAVALVLLPTRVHPALVVALFVYGVGVGLASSQLASVILAEVPPAASGQASGMQSTFRQIGAALGIALLGSIFITSMASLTWDRLNAIPGLIPDQRASIVDGLTDSAGWYINALRYWTPDFRIVVDAVADSITDAARIAAAAAGVFFSAGTLLTRSLPDILREGDRRRVSDTMAVYTTPAAQGS
jgi:EmrB/QacA subfamily drug resistance transporter